MVVIGANPTDAHPVFASRLKRRLRAGARLIVIDPRRIDLVRSPHVEADHHLPLRPGTNVAVLTAMAHVIVTEGLVDEAFVAERCDPDNFASWARFVAEDRHAPEAVADGDRRRPAGRCARPPGSTRPAATAAIYYGLGVTEHAQGSTAVMAIANLAMATGNIGRDGRRREPAPRPEQRPGLLRHGLVPARVLRLPPRVGRRDPRDVRAALGRAAQRRARACASPT